MVAEDGAGNTPGVDDAAAWAEQLGLSFPVLADTEGTFFPAWDPDGILPVAWIIDQDGVIAWAEAGGTGSLNEIEDTVVGLLDR